MVMPRNLPPFRRPVRVPVRRKRRCGTGDQRQTPEQRYALLGIEWKDERTVKVGTDAAQTTSGIALND